MKAGLLIISLLVSSNTFAWNDQEVKTFLKDEKARATFDHFTKTGKIQQFRVQLVKACEGYVVQAPKEQKSRVDCGCYKKELAKIPDEVIFYDSIMAYRHFQERVQALKNHDKAEFERLKAQHAKDETVIKKLGNTCGKF